MIADANLIAAGLFLLPLAMFSRRPIGPQNRGRTGSGSGSNLPSDGLGFIIVDSSNNILVDGSNNILVS